VIWLRRNLAPRRRSGPAATAVILRRRPVGGVLLLIGLQATDWQQHSVRGFLAGTVKKKLGFSLTTSKAAGDVRRYRIATRRGR
jgi:hypothetical protein